MTHDSQLFESQNSRKLRQSKSGTEIPLLKKPSGNTYNNFLYQANTRDNKDIISNLKEKQKRASEQMKAGQK